MILVEMVHDARVVRLGGTHVANNVRNERFTHVGPDQIHYRFTVEDPQAFTSSFTGELPFHRTDDPIYEYACHEGNYALRGILAGAREQEKASAGR